MTVDEILAATRATRHARPDVRNPVLALPAYQRLVDLPEPARAALVAVLEDLAADAGARAETSWRKHKAPMAAYWKAVAVYARHVARALKRRQGAARAE